MPAVNSPLAVTEDRSSKTNIWETSIHFRRNDPQAIKVAEHNASISQVDAFIDFVYHSENQRKQQLQTMVRDLQMMQASGTASTSTKYTDLQFSIADQESEFEQRDLSAQVKQSAPNFKHYDFSCVGSSSFLKQKQIPKLFIDNFATMSEQPKKPQQQGLKVPTDLELSAQLQDYDSEQTCSTFVNLMDQITSVKMGQRRDLHLRDGLMEQKMLKSSMFHSNKSQGGGLYNIVTKTAQMESVLQSQLKSRRTHSRCEGHLPSFESRTLKLELSTRSASYIKQATPLNQVKVSNLIQWHNQGKQSQIKNYQQNQHFQYNRFQNKFNEPDFVQSKIPRHWMTFVQDSIKSLQDVKNTNYEGQITKGQFNGQGQLVYPNGDVYKGMFKEDKRNGSGLCKFGKTGAIYKGEWRDDKPAGNGLLFSLPNEIIEARFEGFKVLDGQIKILMTNGEFYEGNCKQDMRNGQGSFYYKNGDYYEGEWKNDRRVGRGNIITAEGGKMNGTFVNDQAEGQCKYEDKLGNVFQSISEDNKQENGIFTNGRLYHQGVVSFKNGDKYKGLFKDGRPCGHGVMTYKFSLTNANGLNEEATYTGEWKGGRRDGQGTMQWQDGTVFHGRWKNDMRTFGDMKFQNGNLYRGPFINDKLSGIGHFYQLQNNIIFQGAFEQSIMSKIGKLLYGSGDIYHGQHKALVKEGQGKLISINGNMYEGGWANDSKNGVGTLKDATGDVYIGSFQEGRKNGRGRYYDAKSQEIYDGEWSNNRKQGEGFVVTKQGVVSQGDFRQDHMDGKLTYVKTLSIAETAKIFKALQDDYDQFIAVKTSKIKFEPASEAQVVNQNFKMMRKTLK